MMTTSLFGHRRTASMMLLQFTCLCLFTTSTTTAFQDAVPFYLEFRPLQNGIGEQGRFILSDALQLFEPVVESVWKAQLQVPPSDITTYFGGFDVPPYMGDKYGDDSYVQQVLLATAPLDSGTIIKDEANVITWTQLAFANNAFLPYLQEAQLAVDATAVSRVSVDPNPDAFSTVQEILMRTPEAYAATHGFHHLFNVVHDPIQLEFGPSNVLSLDDLTAKLPAMLQALDKFFVELVMPALMQAMDDSPDVPDAVDVFSIYPPSADGTYFSAASMDDFPPFVTPVPAIVSTYDYSYALNYWVPLGMESDVLLAMKQAMVGVLENSFCCNNFLAYLLEALGPGYESITSAGVYVPTQAPSSMPTTMPSGAPSMVPTTMPSMAPTVAPTVSPVEPPVTGARDNSPEPEPGFPIWAIVVIVLGGLLVIAVVVVLAIGVSRANANNGQEKQLAPADTEDAGFVEDNVADDESL